MTPESKRASEQTRMKVQNILGIPGGSEAVFGDMTKTQVLGMLLLDISKTVDDLSERGCAMGAANAERIAELEKTRTGAIGWLRGAAYLGGALVTFSGFLLTLVYLARAMKGAL